LKLRPVFSKGVFELSWSLDRRQSLVDLDDVTDVACMVLIDSERHAGATYELAAPGRYTAHELGAIIARVLGRPIEVREIDADTYLKAWAIHWASATAAMLGGQGQLTDHVTGQEHRPALGGQSLEQVADPAHALGVQAVDRLVEDHRAGIAEQRRGDPQPLPHAQGETPHPAAGHVAQAGQVQDLIHPAGTDGMGRGQGQKMIAGRTPGVDGPGFEQGADLAQRGRVVDVAAAGIAYRQA
jgi:hypothetical protein